MMEQTYNDTVFSELKSDVEKGIKGDANYIPIGFPKLGKYCSIREKMMTLVFSSSGAGKSSFVDTAYILNPYTWLFSDLNKTNLEMETILFSMERSRKYRIAKWIIGNIFRTEHKIIQLPTLMGWWDKKLTKDEHDLFLKQEEYINRILKHTTIYEGPRSPNDFFRICKTHFEKKGTYEKIGDHKEMYISNKTNEITNIILDHGNLTKATKELSNKKDAIDKMSELMQQFRDKESAHCVWVAQVNRSMSNPTRLKDMEAELNMDDVKQSGDVGDACDIGLSLYDPLKYKQGSKTGYKPEDFVDNLDGSKYFRSITVCKSTYGADDVRIPFFFNGFCGDFKEAPKRKDLSDQEYSALIKEVIYKDYFLT